MVVGTLLAARPEVLSLTPEQEERSVGIIADEIFVRLTVDDRPPSQ